jgi:alpha-L-arabinofuranosidase
MLGGGDWKVVDGALRQTAPKENVRAIFGDRNWSGYTYSLKARKLAGEEGFLVLFGVRDDNAKSWWNLGGWGNQRHGLEIGGGIDGERRGRIETNRWYEIRVETGEGRVKCYLDNQLLHDVVPGSLPSLFASTTRDRARGELILKVVNSAPQAQAVEVRIDGAPVADGPAASASTLTADDPMAENSLDQPLQVVPKPVTVQVRGGRVQHLFPGNSLSVIRLKTRE